MSTVTTVPVQIAPEAAERIAELGLRREFEQMLEHARQTIPGVARIEVTAPPRYDLGGDPLVVMEVFLTDPGPWDNQNKLERAYWEWVWSNSSPEVYQHFCLYIPPERANER